jgi:LmbE family N-acetylglucosaminyl deacetylase
MKWQRKHIYLSLVMIIPLVLIRYSIKVVDERSFSYHYDPGNSYRYIFNSAYAEVKEVALRENHLDLSSLSKGVNTVFAEIDLRSTISGFVNQPEIRLVSKKDIIFQNFECRTNGKRYLNLSSLVQKDAQNIQMEFKGCKLKSNLVKLIAFKNSDPSKARILILSPHPDDAEIAAYGLYTSNPQNCFITTITAGDAGYMQYGELFSDTVTQYIEKGKIRAWNSITVPQLGGIAPDHCINLGYFDVSLKKMHDDTTAHGLSCYIKTGDIHLFRSANCTHLPDSVHLESNWRSLVTDLKYLLLKVRPSVIVTVYPALDWHPDHKFTTVAMLQAMRELKYDSCQLWLYTNHFPLTNMTPNGKIRSVISVPPYFDSVPIYFDKLYSSPLSLKLQGEKALALDAMNDIRPNTQYLDIKASWLQTKQNLRNKLYLKETDYFRRSVRSNELFFVIDAKNALQPENRKRITGDR